MSSHSGCLLPALQAGGQLGEPEALRIFLQIFQAVEYCHRRCVGQCMVPNALHRSWWQLGGKEWKTGARGSRVCWVLPAGVLWLHCRSASTA